jgi:hypothetical protein
MRFCGAISVLLTLACATAGCSSDESKNVEPDPNTFPKDYRLQIGRTLVENMSDAGDPRRAMISEPALKPVMQAQRYVACVKLQGGGDQTREKAAIFLGGVLQQFIDATPPQCAGVAYQPFTELAKAATK